MITLSSLFNKLLVFSHLLLVREGNTIETLEGVVLGITQEVRSRVLCDGESLDATSVGHVRTSAQINQGTAAVDGGGSAVRDLVVDDVNLVRVVLEHFQQVFLCQNKTLKGLLFLGELANQLFKVGIISLGNSANNTEYD